MASSSVEGVAMSGFPVLNLKSSDAARSWREFINEFELTVRLRTLEMGKVTVKVDGQDVQKPKFNEEAKLVALLKAVGEEGRETLSSEGLSITNADLTYEKALKVLKKNYERKESSYVRTQKFVTIVQTAGEDYGSYLCRVERLSRDLEFFNNENEESHKALQEARSSLALVIAVNGLREKALCRELIAKSDLNWTKLNDILRARGAAQQSVELLQNELLPSFKQETKERTVAAVDWQRSDSRRDRDLSKSPRSERREYRPTRRTDRSHSRESESRFRGDGDSRYRNEGKRSLRYDSYSSRENYRSGDRGRDISHNYNEYGDRSNHYRNDRSNSRGSDRSYRSDSRERSHRSDRRADSGACYECGEAGHLARSCPVSRCYQCGRRGHRARDCGQPKCWRCGGAHHAEACLKSRSPSPYRPRRDRSEERNVKFLETMENRRPSEGYDS